MSSQTINHTFLWDFSESLISAGQKAKVKAGGNSMYPFIKKGSFVVIKKTDFHTIKTGDIVVFKGHLKIVAHRVIKIKKNADNWLLVCKGDSCNRADVPFSSDKYVGKVVAIERNNKTVNLESRTYQIINKTVAFFSPFFPVVYDTIRFFKHLFRDKDKVKQHL
ncbi:MAG: signal peptidase I [Bacteroidales bacterium]|nr:signal peptidase I [Bacteroidales bacterium]